MKLHSTATGAQEEFACAFVTATVPFVSAYVAAQPPAFVAQGKSAARNNPTRRTLNLMFTFVKALAQFPARQ